MDAVCSVHCVLSEPPNWQMGDDGCRLLRACGPNARRPGKTVGAVAAAGISEGGGGQRNSGGASQLAADNHLFRCNLRVGEKLVNNLCVDHNLQ